jgi:hypothetical protein
MARIALAVAAVLLTPEAAGQTIMPASDWKLAEALTASTELAKRADGGHPPQ